MKDSFQLTIIKAKSLLDKKLAPKLIPLTIWHMKMLTFGEFSKEKTKKKEKRDKERERVRKRERER